MKTPIVFTEGKTDWKHLKAALNALQGQGEFRYLGLSFVEDEDSVGDVELEKTCRRYARIEQDPPTIFVFDRDNTNILPKVQTAEGYKNWTNNVFSFALPIPEHRKDVPGISIEHFYHDRDLRRQDSNGRRLFSSDEFDELGKHIDGKYFCVDQNRYKRSGIIIDSQVYRESDKVSAALSKNEFAEHVMNTNAGFENVDFSAFRPIFGIIWQILQNHFDLTKILTPLDYQVLRNIRWSDLIEEIQSRGVGNDYQISTEYVQLEHEKVGMMRSLEVDILEEITEGRSKRILLSGRPGSGKTFQMGRIAFLLAERLRQEFEITGQALPTHSSIIPLHLRLSWQNVSYSTIETAILEEWQKYNIPDSLEHLVTSGPKIVLLLDELDEISSLDYEKTLSSVRSFGREFTRNPNAFLVIAGRPSATGQFRGEYTVFDICDLGPDTVLELLSKHLGDDEFAQKMYDGISFDKDLLSFLSTPYFVTEIAKYRSPTDIRIVTGYLLDYLVNNLIDRQQKTEGDRTLYHRTEDASRLAFETISRKGILRAAQVNSAGDELISWLRQMGFISTLAAKMEFSNAWLLGYLAVRYVRDQMDQAATATELKRRVDQNQHLSVIVDTLLNSLVSH